MDRAQKAELVSTMNAVFKDTGVVVVAHNTGLVAAQSADFRRKVKEAGGTVKVVKNNLAKLALKNTEFEGLTPLFTGPTILAYSKDPVAAAKATAAFAKANDKLVVIGGGLGTSVLDAKGIKALADLPCSMNCAPSSSVFSTRPRPRSRGPLRNRVRSSHVSFKRRRHRLRVPNLCVPRLRARDHSARGRSQDLAARISFGSNPKDMKDQTYDRSLQDR